MRIIATDVEYTLTMLFANFITNETAIRSGSRVAAISCQKRVPVEVPRRATAS